MFLHDRQTGETTLIGGDSNPEVSSTGRYITYQDDDALVIFVSLPLAYVYDRETDTTTLVHPDGPPPGDGSPLGSGLPSISDDGRFVAFETYAPAGEPQSPWAPSLCSTTCNWGRTGRSRSGVAIRRSR